MGLRRPSVLIIIASRDGRGAGLPGRRSRDLADALCGCLRFLLLLFFLFVTLFLFLVKLFVLLTLALLVLVVTVRSGAVLVGSCALSGRAPL